MMNLRPKTGYSVTCAAEPAGGRGARAWGPPTLMTTDCPGEAQESPLSAPQGHCPMLSLRGCLGLSAPGSLPFPLEVVPGGSPSRPAPRTYQTVLTSTSGPRALVEAVAGGLACGGPRPAASELVLTPGAGAAGERWFPATPVGRGPGDKTRENVSSPRPALPSLTDSRLAPTTSWTCGSTTAPSWARPPPAARVLLPPAGTLGRAGS